MKENQKSVLWFLYSFIVERGRFTQFQMGKKDKSLRKGVDTGLLESLTFFSLQMENSVSHKAYIRSLGEL